MRRKPQDRTARRHGDDDGGDDDDSTPSKLLRRGPQQIRSRYEIDHGSCDWNSTPDDDAAALPASGSGSSDGSNGHRGGRPYDSANNGSPQKSPTDEGLHHRNTRNKLTVPAQQVAATASGYPDPRNPMLAEARGYRAQHLHHRGQSHRGRSYSHGVHGNSIRGQGAVHDGSIRGKGADATLWKRAIQLFIFSVLFGYFFFLYLAQIKNWGEDRSAPQRPMKRPVKDRRGGKHSQKLDAPKGGKNGPALDAKSKKTVPDDGRNDDLDVKSKKTFLEEGRRGGLDGGAGKVRNGREKEPQSEQARGNDRGRTENVEPDRPVGSFGHDYALQSAELPQTYKEPTTPAFERAREWSKDRLKRAKAASAKRLKDRRRRTTPPAKQRSVPLWYELDYSSEDAVRSVQQRWEGRGDDDSSLEENDDLTSSLCGAHAQEAAKHHPQNYRGRQPLGPQSRVMISGILSPLGLHLAIALRRRCNVTNFMGLDSQFPNDPLSRLEAQERLGVLMQELENVKQLQVPFLGLDIKREKKNAKMRREEKARADRLAELKGLLEGGKGSNDVDAPVDYVLPHRRYGVALAPGTDSHGEGALDAVLDYGPTHVVHLAGTQSDSLLGSRVGVTFRDRGEEEEDIMRESVSSRPHLYDLRTGAAGMEQLLAAVAARNVLPPRYGHEDENGEVETPVVGNLPEGERAKMRMPHVVYASSHDALLFRDAASRRNSRATRRSADRADEGDDDFRSGTVPAPRRPPRGLHGASRLVDELLSSSYRALHGVPSIGLRFDAVYGPRGFGAPSDGVPVFHPRRRRRRGVGADVDLAETAVRGLYRRWTDAVWEREAEEEGKEGEGKKKEDKKEEERSLNLIEEAGWMDSAHDRRDFVFVEDAVGAIIVAMQYRPVDNSPTSFNIGSGEMSPLSSLSDEIQYLASADGERKETSAKSKHVIDVERSSSARAAGLSSAEYLRWSATTSLKDGAARLLAWHLDRALPYFPPDSSVLDEGEVDYSSSVADLQSTAVFTPPDGEGILKHRGIASCSADEDDPMCLREAHTSYPCASECSTGSCTPSIFDSVIATTHEATEDCDVVMFTMSLGYDLKEMQLETEFSDGEAQEEWKETTVCTLAFVPSESTLAKDVIDQVPPAALEQRGVSQDSDHETKVEHLNGYLAHHGWVLILVDGATRPVMAEEMFLPKLAPARLFHSTVRKVMFVDESFSHTPYPDDAQFLASETSRGVLKSRTVTGPDAKGRKTKYKLPEEPQRRAVLVVSPARGIPEADGHKMPLKEITLSLMKAIGLDPEKDLSREVRAQREYYERARSLVNSADLRSPDPSLRHRLEIKDFIRSRWIVHHLKLEEGHQLRCEWYREHVRWNTHLDQLSFAYVMARRDLVRRIVTRQPPRTAESEEELTLLQRIIQKASDAGDWHPIISAEGAPPPIHHSQVSPEAIPENLQDLPDHEIGKVEPEAAFEDVGSTYYVRIMSDAKMLESRKWWMKARNNHRKMVKRMKEAAEAANEK